MRTHLAFYRQIYTEMYKFYIKQGFTEDKSSRKANLYAVKNTHTYFSNQFVNGELNSNPYERKSNESNS